MSPVDSLIRRPHRALSGRELPKKQKAVDHAFASSHGPRSVNPVVR
jgi:hypothetical protein